MIRQFKLRSEFQPKGDQPAAIAELVKRLEEGERYQTLLGITGAIYLAGAMALGLAMPGLASVAAAGMSAARARRVFLFSLLYQPFLMALLLLDTVRT